MRGDEKFWVCVWVLAACTIVALGLMLTGYNISKNAAIVSMVKAGADPIEAYCAIAGVGYTGNAAICAVRVEKRP